MTASLLSRYQKPYVPAYVDSEIEAFVRYHLDLRNARDIVLLTRIKDGRIVGANRAAVGAYGYSRRELLRLTLTNLSAPETQDAQAVFVRRAYSESVAFQVSHRRRDGSTFTAEMTSASVILAGQKLLLHVVHDGALYVQAYHPLQQSDEIYQSLVDGARRAQADELQYNKVELITKYDATLTAWAHILEVRGAEPLGHIERVVELTEQLAIAMGVRDRELVYIRHGALLHDIGKLRIPDSILTKPGPLDKDEWDIMRRHPEFAYQMLAPIEFLRPMLDIPYCHHERWDGTGYPRGLVGMQIPLSARIFAVVDVWDALRSDRPFRKALPDGEAMAYIMELSGSHFDPTVISTFYSLVKGVQFHLPLHQPAFGVL